MKGDSLAVGGGQKLVALLALHYDRETGVKG